MNTPLTMEESAFAAENHELVYTYLKLKRYPISEFYDIAIFGYLTAVRTYLSRADLRDAHEFRAIAFQCMRSYISNHFRKETRRKKIAEMIPFDDKEIVDDGDSVFNSVIKKCAIESVREKLPTLISERQNDIIHMKAAGYSNREVSKRFGLGETSVRRELSIVTGTIRNNAPELIELIAA